MFQKTLVHPVPDEAAGENLVLFYDIPVLAQVARAVAHRMGVFDQDEGPVVMRLCVLLEIPVAPIHARMKIGVSFADFVDIALGLVLHGPRQVA